MIKKYNIKAKIISNGYLFNTNENKHILNQFDQVIGELAVTNEAYFQKLQRPLEGYTLEEYILNMESFNNQYDGEFLLDITILKKYSDSDENIKKFKEFIKRIKPDGIIVQTPDEGKLKNAFGIDGDRLEEIENELSIAIPKLA